MIMPLAEENKRIIEDNNLVNKNINKLKANRPCKMSFW